MNQIHAALISYVREAASKDVTVITEALEGLSDEQIVRMMFGNFRGRDQSTRGLRLTNFGMQIMREYFQVYEIVRPEGRSLAPLELIYLDKKAKLPYHIEDSGNLSMFDPDLGIRLTLADGDISTLIEMDSDRIR